jgi:hypothetical protein
MIVIETEYLNQLWFKIGDLFLNETFCLRGAGKYYLYLHNVLMRVKNYNTYELDLRDMGYSSKKINHLLRSYIDPDDFNHCLDDIIYNSKRWRIGGVFTDLPLNLKNNGCILGMTYKDYKEPTLTVYSRSIEFPRKAMADIILVSSTASLINKIYLGGGGSINIVWYSGTIWMDSYMNAYFHKLALLPYEYKYTNIEFQNNVQRGWDKYIICQEKASYRPLVTVQRLYKEREKLLHEIYGELKSEQFVAFQEKYLGR